MLRQVGKRIDDRLVLLGVIVVTEPGLEQVAEDVQRARISGAFTQKIGERLGYFRSCRIEMSIGNKQGLAGHDRLIRWYRRRYWRLTAVMVMVSIGTF